MKTEIPWQAMETAPLCGKVTVLCVNGEPVEAKYDSDFAKSWVDIDTKFTTAEDQITGWCDFIILPAMQL